MWRRGLFRIFSFLTRLCRALMIIFYFGLMVVCFLEMVFFILNIRGWIILKRTSDEDQPNTKRNHTNDPFEVPIGPITRARAKKLKELLNGLVQNKWSKIDPKELGTSKAHEGQPLINLVKVQEEPNSCGTRGWCVRSHTILVRLVFPNDTRMWQLVLGIS